MIKNLNAGLVKVPFVYILLLPIVLSGSELCKVRLDCPMNWADGDTIDVPANVVAVSNILNHCSPDTIIEGAEGSPADTIAVFFLIDHSSSMSLMDSQAVRYTIVNEMIDSLFKKSPASEVGIAVFSNQLLHSVQDDSFFTQLNELYHDSYAPLTKLNGTIGVTPAVQKLKWSIELSPAEKDIGGNRLLLHANYSSTGRHDSRLTSMSPGYNGTTDISLAFEAAQKAFQKSTRPKDKQYIVLLSDGEAQYVDVERADHINDYIKGEDLPTIFTAFFINKGSTQPIPNSLLTMTENIRNNGYSKSNVRSEIWKNAASRTELIQKLTGGLDFTNLLRHYTSSPQSLSINGITTTTFENGTALLPEVIPLNSEKSQLAVSFTYQYENSETPVTRNQNLIFRRGLRDDGLEKECWQQGTLGIFYQNVELTKIDVQQKTLEVRLTLQELTGRESVRIVIRNAANDDSLALTAFLNESYYTAVFTREYADSRIDQLLQNAFSDSVIAIYRNPDVPLDTVILALKVAEPRDIVPKKAFYLDKNANGIPDVIRVVEGTDKLSAEEDLLIKPSIRLPEERKTEVKDVIPWADGFDIIIDETGDIFTGVNESDRLIIDRLTALPGGGEMPYINIGIEDSMAPVIKRAKYLRSVSNKIPDSLGIHFSESVSEITSKEPFNFKNDKGNQYTIQLTWSAQDSSVVTFGIVKDQITLPVKNDSIWIRTTSNIADTNENKQLNDGNVRRLLEYVLVYAINGAAYFDSNRDGLIDKIRIYMDSTPTQEMLDLIYVKLRLPEYRHFTYTRENIISTPDGFEIYLTQPADIDPLTECNEQDVVQISEIETGDNRVIRHTSLAVTDSMPPVINNALYIPGKEVSSGRKDTLIVLFSEKIENPVSNTPFTMYDSYTASEYSLTVNFVGEKSTGEKVFIVQKISNKEFPEPQDSIYINPDAMVTDVYGISQDKKNRLSHLEIKAVLNDYHILIAPNPIDPYKLQIPSDIRNYYGIKESDGVVIAVEPVLKVTGSKILKSKISIYDAVGNLLFTSTGKTDESARGVVYVWNGRNNAGRKAGPGMYLAVVNVVDDMKQNVVRKCKIGIKRYINTEMIENGEYEK